MRVITAAVLSAIVGLAGRSAHAQQFDVPETFKEPPVVTSIDGVLSTSLTAEHTQIMAADQAVLTRTFNGAYLPPTLRVRPGETIRLQLVNSMDQPTNIHYHGLNVSPLGIGDNVFDHIMPGQTWEYEIAIPPVHPTGLFWYHSHMHGMAESQVFGGMSGGLIVEGLLDPFPALRGIKERLMLLKDIQVVDGQIPTDIDSNAGTTRTINGLVNPVIKIQPGETQLWRIGNIGPDIFYRLVLDGHVFYQIARDGNRQNQVVAVNEIILAPSSRVEVLVQGAPQGLYRFRTLAYNTGPAGDQYPEATLATVVSEGAALEPLPLPQSFPVVEDLRNRTLTGRRQVIFSETRDGNTFFINGKKFNPNRVDTKVKLGSVEEWTIENRSDELHVFHIHQLDFQVTEIDGQAQPFVGYQDTITVPVRSTAKVIIPFTNPIIVGKFVYHCHIMAHEDNGMMAVIEVVR